MIYPYLNILTPSECSEIIHNTSNEFKPLQVSKGQEGVYSKDRIAEGTFIYSNPPIVKKIKNIVSSITKLPIEHQEIPNVVKYKVGGHYKTHHDYFDPENFPNLLKRGNRKYTCLFYLNTNFEGGETYFPHYNIKVGPTIGSLLVWDNLLPNGRGNIQSEHSGLPVIKGEKFILVIWVNEKSIK